jgi:uncharacterized protein
MPVPGESTSGARSRLRARELRNPDYLPERASGHKLKKVNFIWDPARARQNLLVHGVSFQEAATIFGDPLALTFADPNHSILEERFITVGTSSAGRILIVAHTDRMEIIRIVSARRTTQRERKQYEEKNW